MNLSLIWLTLVFNSDYTKIERILEKFTDIEKIFNLPLKTWQNIDIPSHILQKISSQKLKDTAKNIIKFCNKENIKIINILDKNYPINLLHIPDPPIILYFLGEIKACDESAISVVGSRNYTSYGRIATEKIVTELSQSGITIISGMARGIDTFAHKSALSVAGQTIAVLGCGVNIIYPPENVNLYKKIIETGAILSEFPPNTSPQPYNFPRRNRIISGLSFGTLVVEAGIKSGSIITAEFAGKQGRDIFAVPGNIYSKQSAGANLLIKDGAKIITSAEDILEELYIKLNIELKPLNAQKMKLNLSNQEKAIFTLINSEVISLEEILNKTSNTYLDTISILTRFELDGFIKKVPGDNFIRETKYIGI